jgi:hypothetical protein
MSARTAMKIAIKDVVRISMLMMPLLFASFSLAAPPSDADAEGFRLNRTDAVKLPGMPLIGKWMIAPDLEPAHWLGEVYEAKKLREPINMIVVDAHSRTPEEAKTGLLQAAALAGFPSRDGHSGGYWGWIGDRLHPQFPDTPAHAFSDEPYELNNDHGRFFGPYRHEGRFIFVGAVSRERFAPLSVPRHQYVSFNRGRDKFADAMNMHTAYRRTAFVNLGNALVDMADVGTGDHDGMAVVLTRRP